MKKRILFVGEASHLNTGFSNIYRELLPRLASTGKFEIAEFGSYAATDDPVQAALNKGRWKFYGNNPETPEENQIFQQGDPNQPGQNTNQFGRWKFESVLADFKPDIVIDIRDWWMCGWQERSPFRKYFKWLLMPTVDSIPQKEEWIQTYERANYVMAYSDFGIDSLRKSSPKLELRMDPPDNKGFIGVDKIPGKLHPVPLRPGVDLKNFFVRSPEEKSALKQKWGIKADVPILLLVQRNQSRKRISEVLRSFALMKQQFPHDEAVQKSILVMHTAWPDNSLSIDFPRAIERIARGYHGTPIHYKRILQEVCSTFMCLNQACGDSFIAPSINIRKNPIMICPKCGQQSARTPTTGMGYTREQLSEVYGMSDLLVQMSIAEGCGMPAQEAKACGVPILVTDYAALSEKGKIPNYDHISKDTYSVHLGGETMDVKYLYEEPETTCWRAMTSMEDCAEKMGHLLIDEDRRKRMSLDARKCAEDHYDWDKNYKEWEYILDHIQPLDRSTTWDRPAAFIATTNINPPDNLDNNQFVEWLYINILGYKNALDIDDEGRKNWLGKLIVEARRGVPQHITRGEIINFFRNQANAINEVERLRVGSKEQSNTDSFEAIII